MIRIRGPNRTTQQKDPMEDRMPRNVAIGLGLMEFPFSGIGGFWRWVDLCEEGGVDSLWQTDRIVSREPILECMSVMAALAGRTRRIKFGVNVVSVAFRDPVLLAKQCATIDLLSDGRLLPAFGIGSPLGPEWRTLNLDTKTRGRKTDEGLEIIGRLWREEAVDFDGVHFHLSGASISPKPVQPDLPMWIGGSSEAAIRRTARFGTGWQAGSETPTEAAAVVGRIREAAAAEGRAIDDDHYGAGIPFRFGRADDPALDRLFDAYRRRTGRDPAKHFAIGDAEAIVERIAAYVAAGISKFILRPAARGDDEMLAQTRRLIEEVLPRVALRWPKPVRRPAPALVARGAA
jgi:probable F420-dependent oxidoreductase